MLYLLGNFKKYIKNNKKIKKELESIYINRNNNLKNIVNQFIISLNVSKYTKNRVNNLNINTILLISENKKKILIIMNICLIILNIIKIQKLIFYTIII